MVGPGEVDDELQPEIEEECQTKYGDIAKVIIFEVWVFCLPIYSKERRCGKPCIPVGCSDISMSKMMEIFMLLK